MQRRPLECGGRVSRGSLQLPAVEVGVRRGAIHAARGAQVRTLVGRADARFRRHAVQHDDRPGFGGMSRPVAHGQPQGVGPVRERGDVPAPECHARAALGTARDRHEPGGLGARAEGDLPAFEARILGGTGDLDRCRAPHQHGIGQGDEELRLRSRRVQRERHADLGRVFPRVFGTHDQFEGPVREAVERCQIPVDRVLIPARQLEGRRERPHRLDHVFDECQVLDRAVDRDARRDVRTGRGRCDRYRRRGPVDRDLGPGFLRRSTDGCLHEDADAVVTVRRREPRVGVALPGRDVCSGNTVHLVLEQAYDHVLGVAHLQGHPSRQEQRVLDRRGVPPAVAVRGEDVRGDDEAVEERALVHLDDDARLGLVGDAVPSDQTERVRARDGRRLEVPEEPGRGGRSDRDALAEDQVPERRRLPRAVRELIRGEGRIEGASAHVRRHGDGRPRRGARDLDGRRRHVDPK